MIDDEREEEEREEDERTTARTSPAQTLSVILTLLYFTHTAAQRARAHTHTLNTHTVSQCVECRSIIIIDLDLEVF